MNLLRRPQPASAGDERPEIELLLALARSRVAPEATERVDAVLGAVRDWDLLLRAAFAHGVASLLHNNLGAIRSDLLPQAVRERLAQDWLVRTVRGAFYSRELVRILALFEAAGLRVLPYKGPVLAVSVYGDVALRPFQDLDVLVADEDYAAACALFSARDWRVDAQYDWETTFIDGSNRTTVDLHRDLLPKRYRLPLHFADLYARQRPVHLAGSIVPSLAPEDALLCLCLQVAKDGWEGRCTLIKICDINELVRSAEGLDWAAVMSEAQQREAERILCLGLNLAKELLGTALPDAILAEMAAFPAIGILTRRIRDRMFRSSESEDARLVKLVREVYFHCKLRRRARDKFVRPILVGAPQLLTQLRGSHTGKPRD